MGIINKWGGMSMSTAVPVYVTRKTAHNETMSYSLSMWMPLLAIFLIWANIVLWGLFGIVAFFWLVISTIF